MYYSLWKTPSGQSLWSGPHHDEDEAAESLRSLDIGVTDKAVAKGTAHWPLAEKYAIIYPVNDRALGRFTNAEIETSAKVFFFSHLPAEWVIPPDTDLRLDWSTDFITGQQAIRVYARVVEVRSDVTAEEVIRQIYGEDSDHQVQNDFKTGQEG